MLLLALGAVGRFVLRLFRARQLSTCERIGLRFLVGFATIALLILGYGLTGLFYQGCMLGMPALLFIAAIWRVGSEKGRFRSLRTIAKEPMARPYQLLAALSVGSAFLFSLVPPVINDALEVTLAVPSHYTMAHKIVPTFRYPLEVPNLVELGLSLGWPALSPVVLLLIASSMLFIMLYGWVGRQWGSRAAAIGLCGCVLSAQAVPAVCHMKVDLTAAGFAVIGFILWADTVGAERRSGQAILAGISLGWGFVSKMPAASVGLGILMWQAVILVNVRPKRSALRTACLFWCGFAVGVAPLLAKGWLMTGNPVFPFFFDSFSWPMESELARNIYGCPGIDLLWRQPVQVLAAMGKLLMDQAVPAWLGLPLVLFSVSDRSSGLRPAVLVALVGIMASFVLAPCLRYMMAPAMLLCMAGGVVVSRLLVLKDRRAGIAHALVVSSLALGYMRMIALSDIDGTSNTGRLAVALGIESEQAFAARRLSTYLPASARAAKMHPKRMLLLGEYRSAYFERAAPTISQCITDFPLTLAIVRDSQSPARIAVKFRQLGVSHVILNSVGSEWRGAVMDKAFHWTHPQIRRYGEFWARWMEWMLPQDPYDYANGGFIFYQFRREPLQEAALVPFLPGTEGIAARKDDEGRVGQKRRLEELVSVVPDVGHFESTLGCVLVEMGEYSEALTHLRHSMRCGFEDPGAYGCMGLALREMGRFREAAESFRKAAALRPDEPAFRERCKECEER